MKRKIAMNYHNQAESTPQDQPQEEYSGQEPPQEGARDESHNDYPIRGNTEELYAKIAKSLWAFSEEKKSLNGTLPDWEPANPSDLVKHLFERTSLNQNTMITYAYALRWDFAKRQDIKEFIEANIELNEFIAKTRSAGKAPRAKKSKSRKSIPKEDLDLLMEELTSRSASGKSMWASPAQRWLQAGIATGLRPGEWITAEWIDNEKTAIRVTTSKVKASTAGFMRKKRSNEMYVPDIRTREIPVLDEFDRFEIEVHMSNFKAYVLSGELSFKKFQDNCGRALAISCKALWGEKKTYTLNSGRKQFSANMRAELGKVATAKLMGHTKANSPAASFYGKANQAYSRTGKNYRKNAQKQNQVDVMQDIGSQSESDQAGSSSDTDSE